MATQQQFSSGEVQLHHVRTQGRLPTSVYNLMRAGECLGYGQLRHQPSHGTDVPAKAASHIYYEVDEASRGQGYGTAFLRLLLDEARALQMPRVFVTAFADNVPSVRVIKRNGGLLVSEHQVDGKPFLKFVIELGNGDGSNKEQS